MSTIVRDFLYGIRKLIRDPLFTVVAIFALALGIGTNTVIFSVVNAVLLRSLPYENSDRLVFLWESQPETGRIPVAPANFVDWKQQSESFESLSAYVGPEAGSRTKYTLVGREGDPQRLQGTSVVPDLFQVMKVKPVAGRLLTPEDVEAQGSMLVMISYRLWQRRFGGDPAIVGQELSIDGNQRTVLGVLPPRFDFPTRDVDLWIPMVFEYASLRRAHFFQVVGRLKAGVSLEQARAEIEALSANLAEQYPETNSNLSVGLMGLRESVVGDTTTPLFILLGAVGFVLLLTCANVANLMLSRAVARNPEFALRSALGASRGQITRQLLTESLVLAIVSGAVSVLLARLGIHLVLLWGPKDIPRLEQASLDNSVLLFNFVITLLTTILFGLVPALISSRLDLTTALKEGGREGSGGGLRTRKGLVIAEVALSLVLVVAAGLMVKSFGRVLDVDPGFETENLVTFEVSLPRSVYQESEQVTTFYQRLLQELRALPGVEAAGTAPILPLKGTWWSGDFTIEGMPAFPTGQEPKVQHLEVSPGYFETMGIPVAKGRSFREGDTADATPVVMVNQEFVDRFIPDRDPVGLEMKFVKPDQEGTWLRIVGVAGNARQTGLTDAVLPEAYVPNLQDPQFANGVAIRTSGDSEAMEETFRRVVHGLDPTLPVYDVLTAEQIIERSISRQRFILRLLVGFAIIALFLAAVGIYGVMSYSVNQRHREIALRMALGARGWNVLKLVLGRGMGLVTIGLVVGILAAFATTRLLSSLLWGVESTDPLTFIVVVCILAVVALIACLLPALRATRVNPIHALRGD